LTTAAPFETTPLAHQMRVKDIVIHLLAATALTALRFAYRSGGR